jgi:hypothetical protein
MCRQAQGTNSVKNLQAVKRPDLESPMSQITAEVKRRATDWTAEESGLYFFKYKDTCVFSITSAPTLGPTQ